MSQRIHMGFTKLYNISLWTRRPLWSSEQSDTAAGSVDFALVCTPRTPLMWSVRRIVYPPIPSNDMGGFIHFHQLWILILQNLKTWTRPPADFDKLLQLPYPEKTIGSSEFKTVFLSKSIMASQKTNASRRKIPDFDCERQIYQSAMETVYYTTIGLDNCN